MSAYVTLTAVPLDGTSIFPILSYGMSDGSFIPDDAIEIDLDISLDLSAYAVDMSGQAPKIIEMPSEFRKKIISTASADLARQQRDALIAATDYLLMADYPITTEKLVEVKVYRQALRDITKQIGFPTTIEWPPIPE